MKKGLLAIIVAIAVIIILSVVSAEYYTSKSSFCGSCHIMKKYHDSWKLTRHNNVKCVDCHYAPGEKHSAQAKFKGLGQLFTYISAKEGTVRKQAVINDDSCMTSDCHPRQNLNQNKFTFKEKIFYIHKTHFDKTIEGQTLHCDTCHQHVSSEKHFEVPREACYLCHFKNAEFNEGRAQCALCHEIPTKSLQKQKQDDKPGEEPVTHQSLEKAKVPCQSCHYELIQGEGEIKEEGCKTCHDMPDMLARANDKKLMHEQHVAQQNAECFDCHRPIKHERMEFLDPVRESCFVCHPDHHKYQKLLLLGDKRKNVMNVPGLMYDVKTNCIGCHTEEKIQNGEAVLHGSVNTCVACHTPKHDKMVKEWIDKTNKELEYAREVEKEAITAIANAKSRVSPEKLNRAVAMLREGQENLRIVQYGGGVHNKKYSVVLLDAALNNFDDLRDLLGTVKDKSDN